MGTVVERLAKNQHRLKRPSFYCLIHFYKCNRWRCRQLLLPSCFSSWWGHTPGRRIGPSVGHSKTARGASATRTTSRTRTTSTTSMFKTAREASATRTTMEAPMEATMEATMEAPLEATMEGTMEATMEATMHL